MSGRSTEGYPFLEALRGVPFTRRRAVTRATGLGFVTLLLVGLALFCLHDAEHSTRSDGLTVSGNFEAEAPLPRNKIQICDDYDREAFPRLRAIESKYDELLDDQFTVVIQTFQRPAILNNTLHSIIEGESSKLNAIIVVWNDVETTAPKDWASPGGIPVKYRQSEVNSLNQKFRVDPDIRTKAVLLADDDTYYTTPDMEYVFKIWRDMGQNRLVGAWPRAARMTDAGTYRYGIPTDQMDYNMILTGLAFTHIAFMDYYSSEVMALRKTRRYVDRHFNCEDIAMNFLTQSLTGCPPLYVKGLDGAMQTEKPEGTPRIGTGPAHAKRRNRCLIDLENFFGKWPLRMQEGYVVRGEVHAP